MTQAKGVPCQAKGNHVGSAQCNDRGYQQVAVVLAANTHATTQTPTQACRLTLAQTMQ